MGLGDPGAFQLARQTCYNAGMRRAWLCAWLIVVGCSDRPRNEEPAAKTPPPPAASTEKPHAAGGIRWDAAPLFRPRSPKSPVRAAEYGVAGEPRCELAVFHYGDQGGTIEGHIKSWLVQFEQADGSDSAQKAKRSELKVGPLAVSTVEITGIHTGPMATPSAPVIRDETESALLGAIVNGPKGLVAFKLSGPRESVERARPAFEQVLQTLRPE